jgi:hypothetical protein
MFQLWLLRRPAPPAYPPPAWPCSFEAPPSLPIPPLPPQSADGDYAPLSQESRRRVATGRWDIRYISVVPLVVDGYSAYGSNTMSNFWIGYDWFNGDE